MIAKIIKGKAFKGCVNYILDKNKDAVLLDAQDIRLKSSESIIQSFVSQAKLNPNIAKSVGHISLSFSAQDKEMLTNDVMVKIARKYMQKMGIKDTQYFIARHFDKEHPHIHLCFNRVDNNGKTISDKNDRFRSEKICKELTQSYGLYLASGKENVKANRLEQPDKAKYELYQILNNLVPKCKHWDQLLFNLKRLDIDVKFKYKGQSDEIQGVTFTKDGYSFTGSKIDRMFSYSKIDFQLKQNSFSNTHSQVNIPTHQSKGLVEQLSKVCLIWELSSLKETIMRKKHSKIEWITNNGNERRKTNTEEVYNLKKYQIMSNESTISIMFEEIKQILTKIENNSSKSNEKTKSDDSLSTSDLVNRVSQSEELILSKIAQIGHTAQTAKQKVYHSVSLDIKSSKIFLTIVGLILFLITSLVLCYKLKSENDKLSDNDIKYRFIKASNRIDSTKLNELENIFVYNRNPKAIKELRDRVVSYEKALIEEAQRLEQAKFKEQEAERLKLEAEDLKRSR